MMQFRAGQILGRGDLDLHLTLEGVPTNAVEVSYAVYRLHDGESLIGSIARSPGNPAVGEYYAPLHIPSSAEPGTYRARWMIQGPKSATRIEVCQDFIVTD